MARRSGISIRCRRPANLRAGTWKNESWKERPNTYSWAFSQTLDAARGIVYVAVEAPGPSDYWGADRPGDNLYGNSLLALDAATGKLLWHFQTVHHDLWDYDLPSPPSLLDVTIGGQLVPVLAQTSKTGYMYVLNRVTGKPVFGIEERRVSKSDVPNEESSPTQPVPVKPPPLARVSFKADDIVRASDTTAEHAAFCQALMERSGGFYNDGPFTPYVFRDAGAAARSTILFPGFDRRRKLGRHGGGPGTRLCVRQHERRSQHRLGREESGRRPRALPPQQHRRTRRRGFSGPKAIHGPGNIMGGERGWLCQRPPWGNLVAVNVRTGDIAWKVPLGVTDELPEGKRNTGRLNLGGPITTAGGLIFIGATNDKRFRAFDAKTGRELWTTRLAMSAHAVPMTYQGRNGKQYVAITASGASALDDPMPEGSEALVVFALP